MPACTLGPSVAAEEQLADATELFIPGVFRLFRRVSGIAEALPNKKPPLVVDWTSARAQRARREDQDSDDDFVVVVDKKDFGDSQEGSFRPWSSWSSRPVREQQKVLQNSKVRRSVQKEQNKIKKIQQRYKRY